MSITITLQLGELGEVLGVIDVIDSIKGKQSVKRHKALSIWDDPDIVQKTDIEVGLKTDESPCCIYHGGQLWCWC